MRVKCERARQETVNRCAGVEKKGSRPRWRGGGRRRREGETGTGQSQRQRGQNTPKEREGGDRDSELWRLMYYAAVLDQIKKW